MKNILIFGASGSIGSYLYNSFTEMKTYNVYGTTTKVENGNEKRHGIKN
jgi:nucleoside-diphosphate-sugar epimerase